MTFSLYGESCQRSALYETGYTVVFFSNKSVVSDGFFVSKKTLTMNFFNERGPRVLSPYQRVFTTLTFFTQDRRGKPIVWSCDVFIPHVLHFLANTHDRILFKPEALLFATNLKPQIKCFHDIKIIFAIN